MLDRHVLGFFCFPVEYGRNEGGKAYLPQSPAWFFSKAVNVRDPKTWDVTDAMAPFVTQRVCDGLVRGIAYTTCQWVLPSAPLRGPVCSLGKGYTAQYRFAPIPSSVRTGPPREGVGMDTCTGEALQAA